MDGRLLASLGASSLALTISTAAEPLNQGFVADDAVWVMHVDIEQFVESTLGAFFIEHRDQLADDSDCDWSFELDHELGVDPLYDIASITLYGREGQRPIGLLDLRVEPDALFNSIGQEKEGAHQIIELQGRSIYKWVEEGDDDLYAWVKTLGDGERSIIIFASDTDRLLRGVEVVEGELPSMASSTATESTLEYEAREGSFLACSISDLDKLPQHRRSSNFAKCAESVRFDFGEAGGDLYSVMSLGAATEEDAANIAAIVQGALAIPMLWSGDEMSPKREAVRRIVRATTVTADERSVTVSYSASAANAVAFLREMCIGAEESN